MTHLTDSSVRVSKRVSESANPQYFAIILASLCLISVLTFLYHWLNAAIFNACSQQCACIGLIGYSAFAVFRSQYSSTINVFYFPPPAHSRS
jgi:hypothetical protein